MIQLESTIGENNYSCLTEFDPPTPNEVLQIILKMREAAPGNDEIRASLIKKVASSIIEPLTYVLSLSLKTGVVPKDLKLAKLTPLFKAGDSSLFNNYQPISVLPMFSKVLEKLVYRRMSKHLSENCILYNHQYGFGKNMSTEMALLQFVNKVSKDLDDKNYTIGIFLDLSQSFDTVNYNILLTRLKKKKMMAFKVVP